LLNRRCSIIGGLTGALQTILNFPFAMAGVNLRKTARDVLQSLDNECALATHLSMFEGAQGCSHEQLRARALQALESLDPGAAKGVAAERRKRQYRILLECDVRGIPQMQVASALGLSRRQFYRDRRQALASFAQALQERRSLPVRVQADAKDVRLLYIQTLRERGHYDAVWRESVRALAHMNGHPREVEVWTVASEAARYLGNVRYACEAIDQMHRAAARVPEQLRRATQLRIAVSEIAMDLMTGDLEGANVRFERVAAICGDEREMYGRDVTLFAILLNYAASIAMESGEWERAEGYVHRAAAVEERSEVPSAKSSHHRLRGRIALYRDGDAGRAVTEFGDALTIAESVRDLMPAANAAVDLGIALSRSAPQSSDSEYIEYGLAIGREMCGRDDFAVLCSAAVPAFMEKTGAERALQTIDDARLRTALFKRAELHTRIAESELRLFAGNYEAALECGTALIDECLRVRMYAAAARAYIVAAEASERIGRRVQAKRLLASGAELVAGRGEHHTRMRARRLGTRLALPYK
jgi:tetratricopeptide (TPR) repeat protein